MTKAAAGLVVREVALVVVGKGSGTMGVPAAAAVVDSAIGVVANDVAGDIVGTVMGGMVGAAVAATSEAAGAAAKPAL